MSCFRVILALICPPLAVIDKGCGPLLGTTILTIIGYVPGVIAAFIFGSRSDD
ncbi:MAG: YqaE/Pmp3 family membrane protein [Muribaculaceae bacterium]|nr:YqaE/Pmp3 family membrane protein [Muribaculaceae bacterium]